MNAVGRLWIVTEGRAGWRVTDAYRGTAREYRAAADALRAIRRSDRRRVRQLEAAGITGAVVSRVEWNTHTSVGRAIVRALQA